MSAITAPQKKPRTSAPEAVACYHCGESCDRTIAKDDRYFCCEGCSFVYGLLQENGLCNYYDLGTTPGIKVKGKFQGNERFAHLDNADVQLQLLRFTDGRQSQVQFHLPTMHCASCIWLLENLHAIRPGILSSQTNFGRKEVFIVFDPAQVSLRQIVELLSFVGYEPEISLGDSEKKRARKVDRRQWYKIGVAGFCFSNIMMLAFPDYFSGGRIEQATLKHLFAYVSLLLALPVFFYSASEFFISAYKGLRQRWLNIDAPIALSICITFSRSVYEVLSGTGPGYFDSMSGIVFFMLIGRWFQNRTYDAFSFDRDYKSYFPLGVTRMDDGAEKPATINELKDGDRIVVRHGEMVPADAVLRAGEGYIDYSFVSGENTPLHKRAGELVYAGARQTGGRIELDVVNTVSQSYITQLWNSNEGASRKNTEQSFIHPWSRYFTLGLFSVAALAALYWAIVDPSKMLPAVSSALIVACPCSLLLSATFTFGNMLRHFGKRRLYLKNASVIEALAKVDTVVLDKTGTLTCADEADIEFTGPVPGEALRNAIYSLAKESAHPLSRLIARHLLRAGAEAVELGQFTETTGKGLSAQSTCGLLKFGSFAFVSGSAAKGHASGATEVWLSVNGVLRGCFHIRNRYRDGVAQMIRGLQSKGYALHLLTGDNDAERGALEALLGKNVAFHFHQTPQSKLDYIKKLQEGGARVLMLGDGLNDAGALMQANAGIAVTENTSQFTPACDAILDSSGVALLDRFLAYARSGKKIVTASFVLSICYNIVGVSIAVQAVMKPMIAAILMPASSISIVSLATLATGVVARRVMQQKAGARL